VIVWFNIPRSFPQTHGQLRFQGITGEIEIIRDIDGVPHIYADTPEDLMFAQGLVEAQDRYWQMDFFRHVGNAELSEMFGASQVETDRFLRTLGWGDIADAKSRGLPSDIAPLLDAYAAGVNAFSDDRRGGELSFEHFVLRLIARDYTPDAWDASDTLVFSKVMAWDLSGTLDEEISRSVLAASIPTAKVEELFPDYPEDHPVIAPSSLIAATRLPNAEHLAIPMPVLVGLRETFAAVDDLTGGRGPDIGSNNWVISGDLTSTSSPLLANDPHLGYAMPSIWYEVGLHCNQVDAVCPFDVTGFSFPGAPGVIIGHNAEIAWGVTNLNPDEMDLYIEKINPNNANQYEYMGEWIDMDTRVETIVIAGGQSERLVVRTTIHGPIISDTYGPLDAELGGDLPERYAISMSWTALQQSTLAEAILGINQAATWDEFRTAAAKWNIAAQNLVFADIYGNIGYQATGRIPIRSAGDGRWPMPGWTGEFTWAGWIPFDELPSLYNPDRGYLASANQPLVDDEYPYHVHDDVSYGFRADRIHTLIEAADGPIDAAYVRHMQSDTRNGAAEIVIRHIIGLTADSDAVDLAKDIFGDWSFGADDPLSGAFQMTGDKPGVALFGSLWRHLLAETFHDDLPEDEWPEGDSRWFVVIDTLLDQPNASWWDDTETDDVTESRDDVLVAALELAVDELGDNPDRWNWTEMYTVQFENASLGQSGIPPLEWILNTGSHAIPGSSSVVNSLSWDAASGSYAVDSGPSLRMIIDLSNFSASTAINTTGQSGHPNHEHYDDMIGRWIANDQHPMRWTRDDVEDAEEATLILFPIPG